jgi:chromosome segregation ATPase
LTLSSGGRTTEYDVPPEGFLIGSVPGCDLRLAGTNLPPVICLIARLPGGAKLRRLSPALTVQVNGRNSNGGMLEDGDNLTIGTTQLRIHVGTVEAQPDEPQEPPQPSAGEQARFEAEVQKLEAEQAEREKRQAEVVAERQQLHQKQREMANERAECAVRLRELTDGRAKLEQIRLSLAEQGEELKRKQEDVELVRRELTDLRRQLYEQYRERRDRVTALQEAVARGAQKVQEQKRAVEAEGLLSAERRREDEARRVNSDKQQSEVQARLADLQERLNELQREKDALVERGRELDARAEASLARERALQAERDTLMREMEEKRLTLIEGEKLYQNDLVRLARQQAALERREQEVEGQFKEYGQLVGQLERERREQEEQARRLDRWHEKLASEAEALTAKQTEHEAATAVATEREGALVALQQQLERQQAAVASLRTRLEHDREVLRHDEQEIAEQRARLAEQEAEQERQLQNVQRRLAAVDEEEQRIVEERKELAPQAAQLAQAAAKLRQTQEGLAAEDERLRRQGEDQTRTAAEQTEQTEMLRARSAQLAEMQERLVTERMSLREREATMLQAETVRVALQDQLRRRAEELSEKQKTLAEQTRKRDEEFASLETRRVQIETERREAEERLTTLTQQAEEKTREIEATRAELASFEGKTREELTKQTADLAHRVERLKESGRSVARVRKSLAEEQRRWREEQAEANSATTVARAEIEALRTEVGELQRLMPELELGAKTAAERLRDAGAQLGKHLEEVHGYAKQRQDDVESLRARIREEAEQVRQQARALQTARDEHRLAVAEFRQQIISWQGQVSELRRTLAHDENRLELRQAEVSQAARAVDDTTARLAEQAEQLHDQERAVAVQRGEMDRHLVDMRDWYRRKLRELVTGPAGPPTTPGDRDILALTGDVDPGDRRLGDLLTSLGLVDSETLTALLVEARRQRRSLRQVLLSGGNVTLYQMALIEAGNVDALALGPVRVIDRVRVTPREAVYRVFDPRPERNGFAILRHLSEEDARDAVRLDEFRQRFTSAAALRQANVAATYEVLDVAGRPAALQEWVTGLSGSEFGDLAAVPGVCYRLLCQAALGLQAAHQAGLAHGRLSAATMILTGEGVLKLCGFGEPSWLAAAVDGAPPAPDAKPEDDLTSLGLTSAIWLSSHFRGKAKTKAAVKPLLGVVERLGADSIDVRYATATALLDDLERIGGEISPNPEAWDRLTRLAREQGEEDASGLRQSA